MAFLSISLLVIGLAPVIAQETSTGSNLNDPQTTTSAVLPYNMTNSTQSVSGATASVSLSTTPPSTSLLTTTSNMTTMIETGNKRYTPVPDFTTKNDMTSPTPEKMTTTVAKTATEKPTSLETDDTTGIIILVIIIAVALGFGLACYFARKKGRRYSVDFTSRPEEANIPLSTMEPDLPVDTAFHSGLQTFENPGAASNQAQEAETTPQVKEEQKAENEKTPATPDAESAAPAATPDSTGDKPKEYDPETTTSSSDPSGEERTGDEGVVSNKTSVESLKETNANNSNSHSLDFESSNLLWDVVSLSV